MEKPVSQSDVPTEKTSATQPFPTKPAPFEHQGITEDDLIDFTPELKAEALEIAKRFRMGPLFTPPSLYDAADGTGGAFTTKTLLIYGEGRGGDPWLHAVDKRTGQEIARVKIPATTNTAPMTYLHEGKQYIVLSVADPDTPAEHVALAIPD